MSDMRVGEVVNALLLLVTFFGVLAAFFQLKNAAASSRASLFKELYMTPRSRPGMMRAFYEIDYDKFVYSDEFHGSRMERDVDELLTFYDMVCRLYEMKSISKMEIHHFDYQMRRVGENKGVRDYLEFLDDHYSQCSIAGRPFGVFRGYVKSVFNIAFDEAV